MMLHYINILMIFAVLNCIHANGTYCGTTWIDTDKNVCCGGQVHDRHQNSVEMACCDHSGKSELYAVDKKICCGDQLIPRQPGQQLKCCNKELIDSNLYGCCGDETFGKKFSSGRCCVDWDNKTAGVHMKFKPRSKCCGTMLYNKDTQRCEIGPNGQKTVKSKTTIRECGTTQYDTKYSLCCSQTEKVIRKPADVSDSHQPDWVCWNGKPFDSKKYYLDERTAKVILRGLELCGEEEYSPKNKDMKCCDGELIPVTPGKNFTCCGKNLWDLDDTSKTCCNRTFIPTATKACCNDVSYDTGFDVKCCANVLYNKTEDICCESQSSYHTITPKQKPHHTNCCRSAESDKMETYNKYTEVCVKGEVREKLLHHNSTMRHSPNNKSQGRVGGNEMKSCPFCKSKTDLNICDKKHVFKFFVYDERLTSSGTILNAVILEPYVKSGKVLNGEKVKIRTRNQCECFKPRRNFYLFTNRKIRSFKENRYNIRFTSEDVFVRNPDIPVACITRHFMDTKWK